MARRLSASEMMTLRPSVQMSFFFLNCDSVSDTEVLEEPCTPPARASNAPAISSSLKDDRKGIYIYIYISNERDAQGKVI